MIKHEWIDLSLRKDVFLNVQAFSLTEEARNLNYEERRFLEKTLRMGKRNGLLLDDEDFERVRSIKKRISELEIDFRKCLDDDTSHFFVHEKELSGVSNNFIHSLEKDVDGRRKVTTRHLAVLNHCKVPRTRFLMEKMYESRCVEENTPRIEELIKLRHEKATILGRII